ncbi:restriction endonuclease subunit S [Pseudidiomarina sp.]|uniref:restriction endonuclease subunit S n=1 Tax=Pseudidiomarina sp. TaxID=2081707 RepID=UPI003A97122D
MSNTSIRPCGLDAPIPKSWHISALGDLFSQRKEKDKTDLPLLAITGGGGVVLRDSLERRDTSNADKSKYLRVCKGDIAYNTMRMWQGVSGLSNYEGIVSPAYTICKPKEGVSSFYMAQLFKLPQLVQIFHRNSQGLVDDTLNLKFENLAPIKVCVPPLPEQQKIAVILSSVDNVIEQTRAQIDKLKNLKTGMMQELLTKGIGVDGKPHKEFKDSPVGRIPISWEVCTLGDITESSAFGPRFSSDFYSESGNIGCIRTTDMDKNWDIDYSTVPLAKLSFPEFESHILEHGDLLITRSGTCGVVDVFQEQAVPMVAAAFLIRFRLAISVNPWFIRIAMMSTSIQDTIQMLASGGVQKNLSGTNLKTLLLPLPSKAEQDEIVYCIRSVSDRIAFAERKKTQLVSVKKALMQDLLTGKVRVKIDNKEPAVA